MRALVTGSSGQLGEALVRTLRDLGSEVMGLDLREGPFTTHRASIADRGAMRGLLKGVERVFHTAALHRPHVDTRSRRDFVDTNVLGTLSLLEEAAAAAVAGFVFTSTTSVFGDALVPPEGAPAAWVTESVTPLPRNIYGVTKAAAEDLCRLFSREHELPCVVLRTARFFPEPDFDRAVREAYADDNMKTNENVYRRVDLEDAVAAHLLAAERAPLLGFARYIVSATTPFGPEDLPELRRDAARVARRRVPAYAAEYARRGWKMVPRIDRVYVNTKARTELGWRPRYDFAHVVARLRDGEDFRSELARRVGSKGYA